MAKIYVNVMTSEVMQIIRTEMKHDIFDSHIHNATGRGVITIMRTRWDIIAIRHLLPFIRYVMYDILIARPHTSAYINLPFAFCITPIPGGAPESPKGLGVDSPLDIFALGSPVHTWRCRTQPSRDDTATPL